VNFCNKIMFYGELLLAPTPNPKLRNSPCRLSATAYSIYSQLPSVSGGRFLHPQPEDAPCRGDKGPTEHGQRGLGCPIIAGEGDASDHCASTHPDSLVRLRCVRQGQVKSG
jgi:hypothetical protein